MTSPRFRCRILLVDDEPAILAVLSAQLADEFEVTTAATIAGARSAFAEAEFDIILADLSLPDGTGVQLLDWVRRVAPRVARILITGAARIEDTIDAINQSRIHRIVLKPWRGEDFLATLRDTARTVLLERNHEQLLEEYRKLNAELEERVADRTKALESVLGELRMKNQILEKMALTDALTGLPNRRAIDLIAKKELLRRTRAPAPLAVGLLDADRFKEINSAHLLSGGDHVLCWLSQTLQGAIRATDALGRVGGEEFMVIAPGTDSTGAYTLAERLRSMVEHGATSYNGQRIPVTISGGFAVVPGDKQIGFEQLREVAAAALAEAKATGRNRSVIRMV